ncbi:metal-sensitive transcriptional regulator [Candidatus Dojkabacteria bacterium]|uniref:Metal-sensitive transcriptional regulator n=1 Tax=Candidatus Dojkabacteria bacterium TaxID=2099670 RepID=A0A955I2F0_9BACT|nr:metal-sensitive transcriptional regulator [Candidatus Dojkabacteria bacterium]
MPRKGPSSMIDRLHRIEGQIRGVEKLLQNEEPIEKVIPQIQAVMSSLESVKLELVKEQVRQSILSNLDEAVSLLK